MAVGTINEDRRFEKMDEGCGILYTSCISQLIEKSTDTFWAQENVF